MSADCWPPLVAAGPAIIRFIPVLKNSDVRKLVLKAAASRRPG